MALSVRSMPSLDRTYTTGKGRGTGRGAAGCGAPGAGRAASRRRAASCASVTAPSPGSPTALRAGCAAREAPPIRAGSVAFVGRARRGPPPPPGRRLRTSPPRPPRTLSWTDAEAVQRAVERAEVDAAVRNRQAGPVVPGRDLRAAGPQLLAGLAVERVQHCVGGILDAHLGLVGPKAQLRRSLCGTL